MNERMRATAARFCSGLALLACLVSGCGGSGDAVPKTPEPSGRPPLNTMEGADQGDRLTVTAVVTGVSSQRSFTVHDADLPDRGVLVLGTGAVRFQDLVTVTGTVVLFTFARFQDRYDLGDPRVYRHFESRKALVADEVRSWAAPQRPPA